MVRGISFSEVSVHLDREYGGRADGEPDQTVADTVVMKELRLAILEAHFDGDNLSWFTPYSAYGFAGDGHLLMLDIKFASPTPTSGNHLHVHLHGGRFTFDDKSFCQDSFQSPRLARLIKDRLLPRTASEGVIGTLDYLRKGILNSRSGVPKNFGCDRHREPLPLGSDHFISMQDMVRSVSFTKALVHLRKEYGGQGGPEGDLVITDAAIMKELRLALLKAKFDGYDLRHDGPSAAYITRGDRLYLNVEIEFEPSMPSSEDAFFIFVFGRGFGLDSYGFAQDSFQSPRLARLIRDRLLPRTASEGAVKTLEYLEKGVLNSAIRKNGDASRAPPR